MSNIELTHDEQLSIRETETKMYLWTEDKLVAACLNSDEKAWSVLIDKYKNLIYSVPVKYGFSQTDSAEIFQSVCVELFSELPRLREPKALAGWLIKVCSHKCFLWKRQQKRLVHTDDEQPETVSSPDAAVDDLLSQLEREQALRQAMVALPKRCRELIQALFYEDPPRPYLEVARSLGLAIGSIGFIRGRCMVKLRKNLENAGFE